MFNQFIGAGNLAADPSIRYTPSGKAVANFTVCCDSGWGDNKKTEFVRCVAWGKLAEIVGEYCRKGKPVLIVGRQETRKWEKDGVTRYSTEVIAHTLKMLGPKGDTGTRVPESPMDPDDGSIPF